MLDLTNGKETVISQYTTKTGNFTWSHEIRISNWSHKKFQIYWSRLWHTQQIQLNMNIEHIFKWVARDCDRFKVAQEAVSSIP